MLRLRRLPSLRALARLAVLAVGLSLLASSCVPSLFGRRNAHVALERRMFELVNGHRVAHGLPPLIHDPVVTEIAREHSRRMAKRKVSFGHRGFRARARAIRQYMTADFVAENVAVNTFDRPDSPVMAVKGLLGSRKHRQNIEGAYRVTGIGVARGPNGAYYYTQLFVR